MTVVSDLYQEVIIEHSRKPRNFGVLENATHQKEGYNPLCGDQLDLFLMIENDVVNHIQFKGTGCAISMASASLLTEAIQGKSLDEIQPLFEGIHQLLLGQECVNVELGKLKVLAGVAEYPMRVKCATLSWHTLMAALKNDE